MFPKSTHETFAQKMYQTYKANKRFSKPKLARTDFTINHYAGDVSNTLNKYIQYSLRPWILVLYFILGYPKIQVLFEKSSKKSVSND